MDEDGRPFPDTLIEVWQTNSAGRNSHKVDQHDAPVDPSFLIRLVTKMYFPSDPLLEFDPVFPCVPDRSARERLIALLGAD